MASVYPLEKEYVVVICDCVKLRATMPTLDIGTYAAFRTLKVSYSSVTAWHEKTAKDGHVDV